MIRLLGAALLGPALGRSLIPVEIGLALQSTLLLGLGLLAGRALRRHGPALPALIYQITLVAALLGGLLSVALGGRLQPLRRSSPPPVAHSPVRAPGSEAEPAVRPKGESAGDRLLRATDLSRSREPVGSARNHNLNRIRTDYDYEHEQEAGWLSAALTGLWGAGALALLGWLLLCQLHLGRLRRGSGPAGAPAAAALAELCRAMRVRPPRLRSSPHAGSPLLTGLWRPVILLPAACERELDGPALRAILAHELVHLLRRDCAWNLLARLACASFWPQPLLWLLCHRLQQAGEAVCDQEVVRLEGDPRAYARCLLLLSERFLPSPAEALLGAGAVPFRTGLGRRIQQILAPSRRALPLSRRLRAAVALGAAAAVAVGLLLAAAVAAPPVSAPEPAPGSSAATSEKHRRPVLNEVQDLDKPVSFSETKIPLGELVRKVSAETGVRLTASPEVESEPVAVVVKDFPARELMVQLADMLDYVWSNRGKPGAVRYEIWQDLAAKNREEALRQAALLDVARRVEEQVRRLAAVAALPPSQIESLEGQYQRWHDTFFHLPPAQRSAVLAKERPQVERLGDAHLVSSPVNRTLALLLSHLSPQQGLLLRQGRTLIFSTDPRPGEQLLPEAESRAFRAGHPDMDDGWRYGDPEVAERERQKQRRMEAEWTAAPGYRVTLRLDATRFDRQGLLVLRAFAAPLAGKPAAGAGRPGDPLAIDYDLANGTSLQLFAEPSGGPSQADEDSPERRAALAKDPLLGAVRRFKREPEPHPRPGAPPRRSFGSLQEMLPDLARSCGLNVIADAYGSDNSAFPFPAEEPAPVYLVLDRITQYGYRWDKKDDLVRIRNRAWCFARPREVPFRIVRAWSARLAEGQEPSMEECAPTAAALTDDQLELLPRLVHDVGQFDSVNALYYARHALRLYASLMPAQQQALWQGQPLPAAAMTPAQRDLFLAPWRDRQQERERSDPEAAEPAPPLDRASRFTMTVQNRTVTAERRGHITYFHWTPAPATPAPSPQPAAAAAGRGAITRRTIAQVYFQFFYAGGVQEGAQVSVAPRALPVPQRKPEQ